MSISQGLLLVLFAVLWLRGRVGLRAASRHLRKVTLEAEESAVRRLRLASQDLRTIGMTLHGNADDLSSVGIANASEIATAAADVFDMSEDLHEFTLQENTARSLREEEIHLAVAIDDAVATVNSSIGPGRRQWHITPEVAATLLNADRRALRHIFTRALTSVVRKTRQHDLVVIGVKTRDDGLAVVIENELFTASPPDHPQTPDNDSRGFSLRLTLARTLMELHGGQLEVDVHHDLGMRVSLIFPSKRVCQSPVPAQGVAGQASAAAQFASAAD